MENYFHFFSGKRNNWERTSTIYRAEKFPRRNFYPVLSLLRFPLTHLLGKGENGRAPHPQPPPPPPGPTHTQNILSSYFQSFIQPLILPSVRFDFQYSDPLDRLIKHCVSENLFLKSFLYISQNLCHVSKPFKVFSKILIWISCHWSNIILAIFLLAISNLIIKTRYMRMNDDNDYNDSNNDNESQ